MVAAKYLDVFSLRDSVVDRYRKFARSFTTIYASDIRDQIEAIYAGNKYWPDPLIQINPKYKKAHSLDELAAAGGIQPGTAKIFRDQRSAANPDGDSIRLFTHQEEAIALAALNESFVVTTGTGSGKSLCFFIPIIDAIIREKAADPTPKTRAIIIYPMNALANSQFEELNKFIADAAASPTVTFKRYTGQEDSDERHTIADNPPDILLTNFMMLELLMTRQEELDRRVIANCSNLRFLVLDELHTYRGRQGADVAMLVRRVRERLAPNSLQCIGTSATMASEGTEEDRNQAVADVASLLFATKIPASNVIGETLDRITDQTRTAASVSPFLKDAIDAGIPSDITDHDLKRNPLTIWVETTLGIKFDEANPRWMRARPLTFDEAARALSGASGCNQEKCANALRDILLVSSIPECDRTGNPEDSTRSLFAFKLHQFFSGANIAYSTIEPAGTRSVTVDGQQFLPGHPEKRLYPVHFCRDCGQEYHPVRMITEGSRKTFLPRSIDDVLPTSDDSDSEGTAAGPLPGFERHGYLTVKPSDPDFGFHGNDEEYPESWLEPDKAGIPRLKSDKNPNRILPFLVGPDGVAGQGTATWFIPDRFRFCLRCGTTHSTGARDRNRLASLSAEGRSSATTVLVSSILHWMHRDDSGLTGNTRKLLGFTDNRQDAALQAGHFNDFIYVSLIRAGFLGALLNAGENGLRSNEIGLSVMKALGFDRTDPEIRGEWLQDPTIKGLHMKEAEALLQKVLTYRVWFDQRRGWRYTNPNLEQLGLVTVDYLGLDDLVHDESEFAGAPDILRDADPETRAEVYRVLFDHLRKWMAVQSLVLDSSTIDKLQSSSFSRLRPPWGFEADERPQSSRWLFVTPPKKADIQLRDEELIVRGSSRSSLGRTLRSSKLPDGRPLWKDTSAIQKLKPKEFDELMGALLQAACRYGLVTEEATPFGDIRGFRLTDECVVFKTPGANSGDSSGPVNKYFRELYLNLSEILTSPQHPLFWFEAREHTAQVDGERRAIREKRFRFAPQEQRELSDIAPHLKDIGERKTFLPVLFCSPTMELGVDISALNAVYLRNVPPTPANYAQRSGRAGRSGQAAFVVTYCAAQSPHDQYFFRDPRAMVHGEVRPPQIDLTNRDLIESHMFATWLACTNYPLDPSISKLLDLTSVNRPLLQPLEQAIRNADASKEARARIRKVLTSLDDILTPDGAPWYSGRELFGSQVVDSAPLRFTEAFDRWRNLLLAAEKQRDSSRIVMDNHSETFENRKAAKSRHDQAIQQIDLLKEARGQSNDFYTYRYLATEGFLPGYNFPRLPLMAYIPGGKDGNSKQTFLQRPRFLAIAEFGPRSLVYHEGRAYRVVRAMLSLKHETETSVNWSLPTQTARLCRSCGAGHFRDDVSTCHACGRPLGDAEILKNIYRIENVSTSPAERITADDEERQRQGFDLQTTFEWAVRASTPDVRRILLSDESGTVASLSYGPGATITRLNKGLRRRADKTQTGFMIDPVTGYWAKNKDESKEKDDPTASPRQWLIPIVQDRKNALLLMPEGAALPGESMATVQHALLRGIETYFQLEEGEVLAEPMPSRDDRKGFLIYEATEGGAGVLTRLVSEPICISNVALKALSIMHYSVPEPPPAFSEDLVDLPGTDCVAGCYRCLLSYFNQPDHEFINRKDKDAVDLLLRLANARPASAPHSEHLRESPAAPFEPADPVLARWIGSARALGLPEPDDSPLHIEAEQLPLVWRYHRIVALLNSPSAELSDLLTAKGLTAITFGTDESLWDERFMQLAKELKIT